MKKLVFAIQLIMLPLVLLAQENKGVIFQQDLSWQMVLNKAKEENKHIFIDAFATWCAPCKQMDAAVYPDSNVGSVMNAKFISVKVQMDSTANDNSLIKSWYKDAKKIRDQYKISGYPSYLFFSPNGKLVYKDLGYKDAGSFLKLVQFATDSERETFRSKLNDYINGERDYPHLGDLAIMTKKVLGNNKLALTIAEDYKLNYLDKLRADDFLTKDNIEFINQNGGIYLINSKDYLFHACSNQPEFIDSLINYNGYSTIVVHGVISKEEVQSRLFKDDQPLVKKPDWRGIKRNIEKKYPRIKVTDFILNEKISFYRRIKNWDLYTFYKSEHIKHHPPKVDGMEVFFALNEPAWDVFQRCDDQKSLKRALEWSELSIKLEGNNVQYLDTRANLLYKLGNIKDAIATEKLALEEEELNLIRNGKPQRSGFVAEFENNLKKMKAGLPTWPVVR